MTKVAITKSLLDDLAASISAKTGETLPLTIAEMTDAVDDMPTPIDTSDANATASDIRSGKSGYVNGSKVSGSLTSRDSTSLSASGDTVTVPAGIYDTQATKAVSAGTAGTPTATKSAVYNNAITVTPSVTNTAGYISGGTKNGTAVTVTASEVDTGTLYCDDADTWNVVGAANFVVDAGTVNNPTATKSAVSNHSVSVTPSVTASEGWIKNTTKTGTAVTVSASELVSGNKEITANGNNIDVANYSTVSVAVPSSGSSKNTQIVQGTTRTNASSLTAIGSELTVSKTGTYDIYYSCMRTNTSSSYTWGTRLYIDGTAYGTEKTTWTNNVQNTHLTDISLTADQKLRVYGRNTRGTSYYVYAPMIAIVET